MKLISVALSAVMLIYSVIMTIAEGFGIGLIPIIALGVIFLICGIFSNKMPKAVHNALTGLTLIILICAGSLAIYGSVDNVTYEEDVIIVLGKGLDGDRILPDLANRLDTAIEYCEKNSDAIIVVSGGKGSDEIVSEALAMERYLLSQNVPAEKIIKEDKSASTEENFLFSKEKIEEELGKNFSVAFVTNKFHVFRAERYAYEAGVEARHIGADTQWYTIPSNYMREIFVTAVQLAEGKI